MTFAWKKKNEREGGLRDTSERGRKKRGHLIFDHLHSAAGSS
jgi:hypothetical protein